MGGFRRNSVIEMQDDTDQRAYFIGDTSSYGTQCVIDRQVGNWCVFIGKLAIRCIVISKLAIRRV